MGHAPRRSIPSAFPGADGSDSSDCFQPNHVSIADLGLETIGVGPPCFWRPSIAGGQHHQLACDAIGSGPGVQRHSLAFVANYFGNYVWISDGKAPDGADSIGTRVCTYRSRCERTSHRGDGPYRPVLGPR
jgi:hypothetical protein